MMMQQSRKRNLSISSTETSRGDNSSSSLASSWYSSQPYSYSSPRILSAIRCQITRLSQNMNSISTAALRGLSIDNEIELHDQAVLNKEEAMICEFETKLDLNLVNEKLEQWKVKSNNIFV